MNPLEPTDVLYNTVQSLIEIVDVVFQGFVNRDLETYTVALFQLAEAGEPRCVARCLIVYPLAPDRMIPILSHAWEVRRELALP